MRFPLLWKEGRESGLALGFGLLWIIGAVEFWLKWGNLKVPGAVHGLLLAFAMVGPLACIVLLSVARFATERHRGTWDFLRALPVPPRRIVASKWVVATGLGTLVIAASSGLAWYPIIHLEPLFGHVGLLHWVAFHCAALVVLLSLLLLLDTLHWGDWLGLRALATFAVLLAFQAAMRSGTYDSWWPTIACLSAAAACAGPAVAFAPRLLGESPLPAWSFQAIARERHFGRGRAWIWMQWTQLRFIVPLLLVPIPMIFAIQTLPRLAAGENLWSGADWLPVFRVAAGYVQFSLCLAAAVLGLALTLMNGRSGATRSERRFQFPAAGSVGCGYVSGSCCSRSSQYPPLRWSRFARHGSSRTGPASLRKTLAFSLSVPSRYLPS